MSAIKPDELVIIYDFTNPPPLESKEGPLSCPPDRVYVRIYQSPLTSKFNPVYESSFRAQKKLFNSINKDLQKALVEAALKKIKEATSSESRSSLTSQVTLQKVSRMDPNVEPTSWQCLDNLRSSFLNRYSFGLVFFGLKLAQRTTFLAKRILVPRFANFYNRVAKYFESSRGYLNITQDEKELLNKLFLIIFQKYKKDLKEEDVISFELTFKVSQDNEAELKKDLKESVANPSKESPIKCHEIAFDVIVRETSLDGKIFPKRRCLFSSKNLKDPDFQRVYQAIDWSRLQLTYTQEEYEIISEARQKKSSSNNCWDHAAIGAILSNRVLLSALFLLDRRYELTKKELDQKIASLKKTFTDPKVFRSKFCSEISPRQRAKFLIDCILACSHLQDDLQNQKRIVEYYSPLIRKYVFGIIENNSQEDAIEVMNFIIAILSEAKLIPEVKVKKIKTLIEEKKKKSEKLQEREQEEEGAATAEAAPKVVRLRQITQNTLLDTFSMLQINLSAYYDGKSSFHEPKVLDANILISEFFDNDPNERLEEFDPDGEIINPEKRPNWRVTHESKKFEEKPKCISFHLERFSQTISGNGFKMHIQLINVPLFLKYEENKFTSSDHGEYQLKSAIIHKGTLNSGHYYLVYRKENQWYIKNDTQDLSNKASFKLSVEKLNEHLQNAVYLHYEN